MASITSFVAITPDYEVSLFRLYFIVGEKGGINGHYFVWRFVAAEKSRCRVVDGRQHE